VPPVPDLRRLRGFRNRPERDLSIVAAVRGAERDALKKHKALGGVGAAWEQIVPGSLKERVHVVSLARGVLTIRAADGVTKFELDRFLRSGGEARLARAAAVAIKRTRIVG
jgi:hypothetical protein